MSAWQPIETAPKDGRDILAICASACEPEASVAWFERGRWVAYFRDLDGLSGVTGWFPSHWMPLPAPPEQQP